ncbi:MAG: hypothetical protein LUG86_09970 [Oscillospiraceae bacterium]|nr:hypothetical protein [Oscillospiraceae bacterium]
MTKTVTLEELKPLTDEQREEIRAAAKKPIVFDEDCPELSPAMIKAFQSSVVQRNRRMSMTKQAG